MVTGPTSAADGALIGAPTPAAPAGESVIARLMLEVMRDSHRYASGLEPRRPVYTGAASDWGRRTGRMRAEPLRDAVERIAARAGFTRRHFRPETAAKRLGRILELSDGLEETHRRLGDDASRKALVDVLKLRVLGPQHAQLRVTSQAFKDRQLEADRTLRLEAETLTASDPWFSPLSLYRAPLPDGQSIRLHCHSVDLVSTYLLGQYAYERGGRRVGVQPGDVVLDVGGCWGDTALYFAALAGPTGRVYTFEFDPESLEILRLNLALNPELAERIEVVERPLWSSEGESVSVNQAGRSTSVSTGDAQQAPLSILTTTVDDFARSAGIERVGFIKMDVEGAEPHVLAGARQTLESSAPRLAIAAYHKDDDLVRLREIIDAAGVAYDYFVETFSPVEAETILFADPGAAAQTA